MATHCSLRHLCFHHRLYFLFSCHACDILDFFVVQAANSSYIYQMGDYKNIKMDQTGFQDSLNGSKVEAAEKEALGCFTVTGGSMLERRRQHNMARRQLQDD